MFKKCTLWASKRSLWERKQVPYIPYFLSQRGCEAWSYFILKILSCAISEIVDFICPAMHFQAIHYYLLILLNIHHLMRKVIRYDCDTYVLRLSIFFIIDHHSKYYSLFLTVILNYAGLIFSEIKTNQKLTSVFITSF